ncbi:MAG: S8 family serine peptidase [bacterium]|nr:S8 family serine peptidase [bacterium]
MKDTEYRYDVTQHRMQWWLQEINWSEKRMKLGNEKVKIAIIDSGVDVSHPDLKKSNIKEHMISSLNKVDNNYDYEHGTLVAGIISAMPNDERGILGINPEVEVISIDVTSNDYVADGMSITNLFGDSNYYRQWKVKPDKNIKGQSRKIEPGISVVNRNTSYKSGAFTSIRDCKIVGTLPWSANGCVVEAGQYWSY